VLEEIEESDPSEQDEDPASNSGSKHEDLLDIMSGLSKTNSAEEESKKSREDSEAKSSDSLSQSELVAILAKQDV
jgi:hypothetical protein